MTLVRRRCRRRSRQSARPLAEGGRGPAGVGVGRYGRQVAGRELSEQRLVKVVDEANRRSGGLVIVGSWRQSRKECVDGVCGCFDSASPEEVRGIGERGCVAVGVAVEHDGCLDVSELAIDGQICGGHAGTDTVLPGEEDQFWVECAGPRRVLTTW